MSGTTQGDFALGRRFSQIVADDIPKTRACE